MPYNSMPDNQPEDRGSTGSLGAILGALIAAAFAIFLLNGGEHFGKTTINSDDDPPPVQTGS